LLLFPADKLNDCINGFEYMKVAMLKQGANRFKCSLVFKQGSGAFLVVIYVNLFIKNKYLKTVIS